MIGHRLRYEWPQAAAPAAGRTSRWQRQPAATGARYALGALTALLLAGCGGDADPTPAAAAPEGLLVAAWNGAPVDITVGGMIDHINPIGHTARRAWIPVLDLADQGQQIAAGELLAVLDADVAREWRDNEVRSGDEREADARRSHLRSAGDDAQLDERAADLRGRIAVAEAAMVAAKARDADQIVIAQKELELARRAVATAEQDYERMVALAASGSVAPRALADATNRLALARAEAEAPALNLEILQTTTQSVLRFRLHLDLARLRYELEGVDAQIQARNEGRQRAERLDSWDVEKRRRQIADLTAIVEDPTIVAAGDGVVRHHDAQFTVGSKPGWDPFSYVLDQSGLVVECRVRDRWRPWLDRAAVRIEIPALGRSIAGRVSAIAAQPEAADDGTGQVFRVLIDPLHARETLLPGQRCRCHISLDLGATTPVAMIPAWLVADRRRPQVTMADGSLRTVEGIFHGEYLLVIDGLQPGERIQQPREMAMPGLRLSGIIEARKSHPIRLLATSHRDGWAMRWMIADGTRVEAGQEVASLTYTGWGDPADRQFGLDYAELEAQARLVRERMEVAASIANAAAAWRGAMVEAERTAFEILVAYATSDDPAVLSRRAAVTRAENELRSAEARMAELDRPAALDAISANDAEQRRLDVTQARQRLLRQQLAEVATRRSESYLQRVEARAAADDAQANMQRLRMDYVRERLAGQARLFKAAFERRRNEERRHRDRARVEGTSLRAPVAGVVFQRPRRDGRLLRIGDQVDVDEPMLIPIGNERKIVIEWPAHRINEIAEDETVPVHIPALDREPRQGRVASIARAVIPSNQADDEELGLSARVVPITIVVTLTDEELLRVPLGSTAYVQHH